MKKSNLLLTITALINLLAFSGCSNDKTSSVSNSQSANNIVLVNQDLSVVSFSGTRINNAKIDIYSGEELVESVVTNYIGNANIDIYTGTYTVKLSNLPKGYISDEEYEYVVEDKYAKVTFKCRSEIIDEEMPSDYKLEKAAIMYNIEYTDTDDNTHSLKSLFEDGKDLVILNFWGSWCGYCTGEFPYFDQVSKEYSENVEIIAFNDGTDSAQYIKNYREEEGFSFTMATGNYSSLVYGTFKMPGLPLTIFVSKYGVVEHIQPKGFSSAEEIANKVDSCLKKIG